MSTEAMGYQGWANYETWAVHLWVSNDQGAHEHWEQLAADEYAAAVAADPDGNWEAWTDAAATELAERMKQELDDEAEEPRAVDNTMYADLLSAALEEVNWFEVAEAYVENTDRDRIEADNRPGAD